MNNSNKILKRDEISIEYRWKLKDIFPSRSEWEKTLVKVMSLIPKIDEYKGKLGQSANTLYNCLSLHDEIFTNVYDIFAYARMKRDEDTNLTQSQDLTEKAISLITYASTAFSFIVPELTRLPKDTILEFIKKSSNLKNYTHFINNILRQKKHVLSKEEENLLSMANEVFDTSAEIFSMFNNADLKF